MIGECLGLALGGACLLTSSWTAHAGDLVRLAPAKPRAGAAATLPFLVSSERQAVTPERVRGVRFDFDEAEADPVVTRTEVTSDGRFAPIAFMDSGTTRDFAGRIITPTAAGLGFDYRFAEGVRGYLLGSYQLTSGPISRPGDIQIGFLLRLSR